MRRCGVLSVRKSGQVFASQIATRITEKQYLCAENRYDPEGAPLETETAGKK